MVAQTENLQSTQLCSVFKVRITEDLRPNYVTEIFSCSYSSSCQFFQTPEEKPYMPLKSTAITGTLRGKILPRKKKNVLKHIILARKPELL